MIKKLSLLILIFLLSASSVFASGTTADKVNTLTGLGIISEDYSQERTVTLNEFLKATVNMMSEDTVADDEVYDTALVYGLIKKADKTELQSAVSFERALNIALNAMGYTHIVEMTGNDVNSVIESARSAELLTNVSGKVGESITGEAVINLLYNMTEAPIFDVTITGGKVEYEMSEDKTVLSYFRKISVIEGTVTATDSTSDSGADGLENGKIAIGDVIYDCDFDYTDDIIGLQVIAYVYDVEDEARVLYIGLNSKKLDKHEIDAKDIDFVANNFSYLSYVDNNKVKKLNLNPALKVVYNGKFYDEYTKEDLMPKLGGITVIDTDDDKKYDYVHVKSYQTMVVTNVSVTYKTITSKYSYKGSLESLDLSGNDITVKYYKDGAEIPLSDIRSGDVLNVAISKNETYKLISIYVSSDTLIGQVTGRNDTEKTVKIGDAEYPVSYIYYEAKENSDKNYSPFDMAQEQAFYLDNFGNVACVSGVKNGGYEYVYMLKLKFDDSEEKYFIKSLNTREEWEIIYFDSKVSYNGETRKDASSVYKTIVNSGISRELVLIKKNSDGLITHIKLPQESGEYVANTFTKQPQVSRYYWTSNQTLDYYEYVNSDLVVFTTPGDNEDVYDESLYTVESSAYFRDWGYYTYHSYNEDEFGYPEVLVMKGYSAQNGSTMFVNDVIEVANADGDTVKAVIGNIGGILDLRVPELEPGIIGDVKPGDVISVNIRNGGIKTCSIQYSMNQGKQYGITGQVYNTVTYKGDVVSFDAERGMVLLDCGTTKIPLKIDSSVTFNVWNPEIKKFDTGNFYDLEKGDYAFVYGGSSDINTMVVYKQNK